MGLLNQIPPEQRGLFLMSLGARMMQAGGRGQGQGLLQAAGGGLLGAMQDTQQAGLLKAQMAPKQTSLMQNLAAMGLQPGTPEYEAAMRQAIMKPTASTTVNVGGERAEPVGLWTPEDVAAKGLPAGTVGYDDDKGAPKIVYKPPEVTEGEAQKSAQSDASLRMLQEIRELANSGKIDFSAGAATMARARAGGGSMWQSALRALTPGELTDEQAKLLSLEESLSTQLIAAMRGAQVGPQEQEKFERQLPRWGQDEKLFRANIDLTEQNLRELGARREQMRRGGTVAIPQVMGGGGIQGTPIEPPLPPGARRLPR